MDAAKRSRTWCLQEQAQQVPPRSTPEAVAAVVAKCVAAEPRHGERWQAVSKSLQSAHMSTEQILMLVVAGLADKLVV